MKDSTKELLNALSAALWKEAFESKDTSDIETVAEYFSNLIEHATMQLVDEETNQEKG